MASVHSGSISVAAQNAVAPLGLAGAFVSLVTHGLSSEPTAESCDSHQYVSYLPVTSFLLQAGLWGCIRWPRGLETPLCSWEMPILDVQEPCGALEWQLNASWDSQGHLKCPFIYQVWTYPISSNCLLRNFLSHYCFYFGHYHIHSPFISQGLPSIPVFLLMKNTALFICSLIGTASHDCSDLLSFSVSCLCHPFWGEQRKETGTWAHHSPYGRTMVFFILVFLVFFFLLFSLFLSSKCLAADLLLNHSCIKLTFS